MHIERQRIITHRGLEPTHENFFSESSLEAFENHLSRGFGGIEFDPNLTSDGEIIIMHDATLDRPTSGLDLRSVKDVPLAQLRQISLDHGRIPTFEDIAELIRNSASTVNALHLKARFQTPESLEILTYHLDTHQDILNQLLIFDVKPNTARILKTRFPELRLAPSVAHPYDIERYNDAVGNTLLSIEEALSLKNEGVIDGVWGDEWDRKGVDRQDKKFYTRENFSRLKDAGLFVALVTPELHATSPGLYGGESHSDAKNTEILMKRIKEIIEAGADYLCTDYPEEVATL